MHQDEVYDRRQAAAAAKSRRIMWYSIGGIATTIALIVAMMIGLPIYSVWQQGLSGEAALKKAEQTRQILIEQAKAEEQAATFRANAIEIVGAKAQQYPEYRQQEFMAALGEALQNGNISQILYLPTEAAIPITEANRLRTVSE